LEASLVELEVLQADPLAGLLREAWAASLAELEVLQAGPSAGPQLGALEA
jgi:hypothetical protein